MVAIGTGRAGMTGLKLVLRIAGMSERERFLEGRIRMALFARVWQLPQVDVLMATGALGLERLVADGCCHSLGKLALLVGVAFRATRLYMTSRQEETAGFVTEGRVFKAIQCMTGVTVFHELPLMWVVLVTINT